MSGTTRECDGKPLKPPFGWSQSGKLTVYQNNNPFVSLQANFEECDIFTVEFGIGGPTGGTPANPILTTATIIWTIAGNDVIRKISVANGATISGLAESVRVIVNDATQQNVAEAPSTFIQYGVTVLVGRGVRPDTEQPPVLQDVPNTTVYTIAQGTSKTIPVPQNVGVISVHLDVSTSPVTPGALQVDQVTVQHLQNGTVLKQYDPRVFEWVPLASSADNIKVTNNFGGGGPALIVTVAWGIDG